MHKRVIGIMVGSDSDLVQCEAGLKYLQEQVGQGTVEVVYVITNSIHRNTNKVLDNVLLAVEDGVDLLLVGAGWANHLTGTVDVILRYGLNNDHIVVVGVAFEDKENSQHTEAAKLSITEVPGTQVVFNNFVGAIGFEKACIYAVETVQLPKIKLKEPKPTKVRSLSGALELINQKNKE